MFRTAAVISTRAPHRNGNYKQMGSKVLYEPVYSSSNRSVNTIQFECVTNQKAIFSESDWFFLRIDIKIKADFEEEISLKK